MVDRITPVTTDADRAEFEHHFGYRDRWPVYCEPFTQWVLEDLLPADGRPPLEQAGVQLVGDVAPYELMKLRLLNAGHQALGYLGALAGHEFVHEASEDPALSGFLRAYLREVTPTLRPVPGIDLGEYRNELVARFANPGIADRLARICAYSSDRMPKFVLTALLDNVRAGRDVRCAALVVAAWRAWVRSVGERGESLVDAHAADLDRRAWAADPMVFVSDRSLFGDLAQAAGFVEAYQDAVSELQSRGPQAAAHLAAQRAP
jgi:mannitol 2-dehydrogenase